jgi:hypothetical protein
MDRFPANYFLTGNGLYYTTLEICYARSLDRRLYLSDNIVDVAISDRLER